MKSRIITGLMLVGLMATAGASAQDRYSRSRNSDNRYTTENNDRYTDRYGDGTYDYNNNRSRYEDRNYDKRSQRQARRSNRTSSRYGYGKQGKTGYDNSRYYRNNRSVSDRYNGNINDDNGRYINNTYRDGDYMNDRHSVTRYDDRRSGNNRYGSSSKRQMRRGDRNNYKNTNYGYPASNRSGYDYNRNTYRSYDEGYNNGNRNTRFVSTENEGDLFDRPLNTNRRTTGNYGQTQEGQMDYDTWMRHRNNTRGLNNQTDRWERTIEDNRRRMR